MRRRTLVPSAVLLMLALLGPLWPPSGAVADGTPVPVPRGGTGTDGGLGALLDQLPAVPLLQAGVFLTYADLATQLAAVGVAVPNAPDDEAGWRRLWTALHGVYLPQSLQRVGDPAWRATVGFDLVQVDTAVELNAPNGDHPPIQITLLRGRFTASNLQAAWVRGGYQTLTLAGATVYSRGSDDEIDFDDPIWRLVTNAFDNATLLDDGTLAFARTLDQLESVLTARSGTTPTLSEQPQVAALLRAARPDLAAAVLLTGPWFRLDPLAAMVTSFASPPAGDLGVVATAIADASAAAAALPPVVVALVGTTVGGPLPPPDGDSRTMVVPPGPPGQPVAKGQVAVVFFGPKAARDAVPVVEARLAEWAAADAPPYADLFPKRAVRAVPGEPVVIIELGFGTDVPRGALIGVLGLGQPGFLVWG